MADAIKPVNNTVIYDMMRNKRITEIAYTEERKRTKSTDENLRKEKLKEENDRICRLRDPDKGLHIDIRV
ncbi:MAG: hypothetical protein EB101_09845 [Chitinophagia bacterium]|nr:hypothetical protein [Chitinophagia bacterium]